ncbi:DUF3048 domain-containing protein [Patescibacteria group bacterium]
MPENIAQPNPNNESLQSISSEPSQPPKPEQPSQGATYPSKKPVGNKKILKIVLIVLGIGLVLFAVWFFILRKKFDIMSPFAEGGSDSGGSEKVINDLTGVIYTEKEAREWKDERPFGVMINNYIDARPQAGLIDADLVYEIVAEGGITRFLSFFLTNSPEKIGPVRSAREYYLVLVKELSDAMIMHIGWSPQALYAIENWPVRSLQRGGCEFYEGCTWRDTSRDVAIEHTAYVDGTVLRELGADLGWAGKGDITLWVFKDDTEKYASKPESTELSVDFWYEGDYSAIFKYDQKNNSYMRYMGYDESGEPIAHKDAESKDQVEIKNVVVQFVAESPVVGDDKNRLEYELVGSGSALVFIDGKVIESTWSKEERDSRTIFYDTDGNEIEFNRGKFWICIVPDRNVEQVVY